MGTSDIEGNVIGDNRSASGVRLLIQSIRGVGGATVVSGLGTSCSGGSASGRLARAGRVSCVRIASFSRTFSCWRIAIVFNNSDMLPLRAPIAWNRFSFCRCRRRRASTAGDGVSIWDELDVGEDLRLFRVVGSRRAGLGE